MKFLTLVWMLMQAPGAFPEKPIITYSFEWEQPETKLELKMFEAPISMLERVGEQGEYNVTVNLPILRELADQKIEMSFGEERAIYLVAKNNGKKDISFYVAPHHIKPASASLGFNFRCLCYNHIYKVKAGKLWYRVMKLKTHEAALAKKVHLVHTLIKHQARGK